MLGWVVNMHEPGAGTRRVERDQQPNFYITLGVVQEPVFEVWLWDDAARLWFVMTTAPQALPPGVVPFDPRLTEGQLTAMRDQWREYRRAGGEWPTS